jgi:hypothetical protein
MEARENEAARGAMRGAATVPCTARVEGPDCVRAGIIGMSRRMPSDPIRLREEIAQAAARMIAEDGADYATAKRKAARQMLGDARGRRMAARQRDDRR